MEFYILIEDWQNQFSSCALVPKDGFPGIASPFATHFLLVPQNQFADNTSGGTSGLSIREYWISSGIRINGERYRLHFCMPIKLFYNKLNPTFLQEQTVKNIKFSTKLFGTLSVQPQYPIDVSIQEMK